MKAAEQAFQENHLAGTQTLLNAHLPKKGEKDLRGLEWHFIDHRLQQGAIRSLRNLPAVADSQRFSHDDEWLVCGDLAGGLWKWQWKNGSNAVEINPDRWYASKRQALRLRLANLRTLLHNGRDQIVGAG